jgi:hypothetical protein
MHPGTNALRVATSRRFSETRPGQPRRCRRKPERHARRPHVHALVHVIDCTVDGISLSDDRRNGVRVLLPEGRHIGDGQLSSGVNDMARRVELDMISDRGRRD